MNKKLQLKPAVEAMKVGDELSFPVERLSSVKTTVSNVGLVLNRKYCSKVNRAERIVNVVRVS